MSKYRCWLTQSVTIWGQNDIIRAGRMTSFCQCFLSVWLGGLDSFSSCFSGFPLVSLKHSPPWERLHQLLTIFTFPACCKYFSMSDTVTGSHPVRSPGIDLKGPTESGSIAQSGRFPFCFSETMYSCWAVHQLPSPCLLMLGSQSLDSASLFLAAFPSVFL